MALINCPECGKQISDKAPACPNCGCPMSEMATSGTVRIKIPNNVNKGLVGLFASRNASVTDNKGKKLWTGKHGENAKFTIDDPTKITVDLGGLAYTVSGEVAPGKKYSLVQDTAFHMLATYRLTEVDVIDAD